MGSYTLSNGRVLKAFLKSTAPKIMIPKYFLDPQRVEYILIHSHIIKINQKDVNLIRQKAFLIGLSIMGVFIIYFGIASLNGFAEKRTSPPPKSAEVNMWEKIEEKISGKYEIGGININTHVDNNSKNIDIDILGSQEYYDSVKNEIEEVVKTLIKSTKFETYNVNVRKNEITQMIKEELLERHNLIGEIGRTIEDDLSTAHPKSIDGINMSITPPNSPSELIIEVNTRVEGENQKSIGREIENTIYNTLEKKLSSNKLVNESNVKIYIYNKRKEKINTSF